MSGREVSRRTFVQVSGGAGAGLVLGISLAGCRGPAIVTGSLDQEVLNAWIRIGTDESVTFVISESEMGQGVHTALSMLLAEELEVDWSRIRTEHALTDRTLYGRQSTGGSTSIRTNHERLRIAGAAAREMLIAAAAARWGVQASECRAEDGQVVHTASGRSLSYGSLAEDAALLPAPDDPPLKDPADFRLVGQRMPRLDSPEKVDGSAVFGLDMSVPGMLTALVARPPTFGGAVGSFDATAALAVPGVRHVVEIPTGIVVAADGFWAAKQGRDALTVQWNSGEFGDASDSSIRELCQKLADEGAVVTDRGDVAKATADAKTRIDAEYDAPFLAHATMEPMNCVAHVRADGCDVWTGTQAQTSAQDIAAEITKLDRQAP